MADKRRTSVKLSQEVFDHVEEYQEEMGIDTRQGAMEQLLRQTMSEQSGVADRSESVPWDRERTVVGWCGTLVEILLIPTALALLLSFFGHLPWIVSYSFALAVACLILVALSALVPLSIAVARSGAEKGIIAAAWSEIVRNVSFTAAIFQNPNQ